MERSRLFTVSVALCLAALLCGCGPKLPEKYGNYYFHDGRWTEMPGGNAWTSLERTPRFLVHNRQIGSGLPPAQFVQLKPVTASRRLVEEICNNADGTPVRYTLNENVLSLTVDEDRQMIGDFYPVSGNKDMVELRFDKGLAPGAYVLATNESRCQCLVGANLPGQLPAEAFRDTWYRTLAVGQASPLEEFRIASQRGLGAEQTYEGRRIVSKEYRSTDALDNTRRSLTAQLEKDVAANHGDFASLFNRIQALQSLDPSDAKKIQEEATKAFDEAVVKAAASGDPADVLRYESLSYRASAGGRAKQILQETHAKALAATNAARQRNDQLKHAFEKVLETKDDYGEPRGELHLVTGQETKTIQLFDNGIRWTEKVFFGSGKEKRWFGDFKDLAKLHQPGDNRPWAVRLECANGGDTTFEGTDQTSRDQFFQQLRTACEAWHQQHTDALETPVEATSTYGSPVWIGAERWSIRQDPPERNYFVRGNQSQQQDDEQLVTPDTSRINVSFENGLSFRSSDRTPVKLSIRRLPFASWNAARETQAALEEEETAVKADGTYRKAVRAEGDAEWEQAANAFNSVLQKHPSSPSALNALAWLRATCPEAHYRNGQQAVELALKACGLENWESSGVIDTLAAAYAETSDYAKAADFERRAIATYKKTQTRAGRSTDTPDYDRALARYLEGKPTRQKVD